MHLKDLIQGMPVSKVEGTLEREITGITYDSRRVTPGMLFAAIPGQKIDGHEFINTAIERGALAVICERNGFTSNRATKIKVPDARAALARAANCYYANPSAKLKVIGVTGTNGKTTVTFLIKSILEAAGLKTGLLGTVRYEIGDRIIPAHRTTPESLEVQHMMAQMLRADCQACVMEVSSHALEQKRVLGVAFDVGIFTNLTGDHLDYHGTMENYFGAKKKLFTGLEEGPKQGLKVINIDDTYGQRLADESRNVEIDLTYGVEKAAKLRATQIQLTREGSRFVVETPDRKFAVRLPLIGRHNIYNALAAVGAGLALKVDVLKIQAALNATPPVPGRLEMVSAGQPFGVYVDYAHTDDALENVLKTVREIATGQVLLAFGCGGNRDSSKRARMGKVAAEMADFTVITSDNPRKESAEKIAGQIEEGFRTKRAEGYVLELDRSRAIGMILAKAKPGDIVVIAGKGHETYQEFEDTVVPFDDRVHAVEALEHMGFREAV
ncbi:MAG TPA: UDP-N-acetylmuramoyl-L-alanyl-D-glutamate--2,6-diaminopimelate ligase [Candidatus Saccharimonadales bacterium]|nr:UDP-N-acetylmuramoyl-L-alanyl-D-glutamate--2,6-diaminopimelate ligase [Candidatus Saccharimonadales bacterium]